MSDKHYYTYDEIKGVFEHWGIPYTEERAFLSDNKELYVTNKAGMIVKLYFSEDYHNDRLDWVLRNVYIDDAGVAITDVYSIVIFTGSAHNDIICCDKDRRHAAWIQIPDVV